MEQSTLTCRRCDWEATIGTDDRPHEADHAAIDHHLVFGHPVERVPASRPLPRY
ncbi:hypothetical protein [Halalkalicoccus sp. NIPERK01]|uniref:hypothetical protein n=1 Tax=Halalkalicoccus sp. NIPERK01 TaxID=3053469 RepID=UPI00256EFFD6|nr:hypothetical protein [Halalkalicoccus sp. NIPERK01]MDL5362541.1 hypothetical protein [Halalkalicoccus sp. NIPERK01]